MTVARHKLAWFRLKCPYQHETSLYKDAYSRLSTASLADMNRLDAEFEAWCEDNHTLVTHHYLNDEWVAVVGSRSKPSPQLNMKAIQRHGHKYRVQKRSRGQLRKWIYETLKEAVAKRDTVFG